MRALPCVCSRALQVKLLLVWKADLTLKDVNGALPKHVADRKGHTEIARAFVAQAFGAIEGAHANVQHCNDTLLLSTLVPKAYNPRGRAEQNLSIADGFSALPEVTGLYRRALLPFTSVPQSKASQIFLRLQDAWVQHGRAACPAEFTWNFQERAETISVAIR